MTTTQAQTNEMSRTFENTIDQHYDRLGALSNILQTYTSHKNQINNKAADVALKTALPWSPPPRLATNSFHLIKNLHQLSPQTAQLIEHKR